MAGADLITLEEYKLYKGISTPKDDDLISSLITQASQLVKTTCRRTFVDYKTTPAVTVYNNGWADNLIPIEYPVISVDSLEYSDDYGSTYAPLTPYTDFVLDITLNEVVFISAPYNQTETPPKPNRYRMTYKAGYDTLPDDLKLAVMDLVTYYMRNDGVVHARRDTNSATLQIDYMLNNKLPPHISRVLDLYMANYA